MIIQGNALHLPLADESVHCVVTSPPYYGLRDYGIEPTIWGGESECAHIWGATIPGDNRGGSGTPTGRNGRGENYGRDAERGQRCQRCGAWRGTLGLEPTPELYVAHLVEVFREVRRVMRSDATLWLNLGDSYASGGSGSPSSKSTLYSPGEKVPGLAARDYGAQIKPVARALAPGLKPKDLIGIPWRVAFALQADGWWLRSDIIWAKPNCMPESVTDRPTKSHEYLFLLSKAQTYYYDAEAIKEPQAKETGSISVRSFAYQEENSDPKGGGYRGNGGLANRVNTGSRNKRDVWWISTKPYSGAHFAVMPPDLVRPCILAGTSERGCCPQCGAPWERVVERGTPERIGGMAGVSIAHAEGPMDRGGNGQWDAGHMPMVRPSITTGWRPTCSCGGEPVPCVVLDPFGGAGTTAKVALELNRLPIAIELRAEYCHMALERIDGTQRVLARTTRTQRYVSRAL